jgi:hypothetical protein
MRIGEGFLIRKPVKMNIFFLILGVIFTFWTLLEALWTTIWVDGNSAPLTSRLTSGTWKLFRSMINAKHHRTLSLAGPVILASTVFCWIIFLWLGWTLIFYANPTSLLVKSTNSLPDFSDAVWYVAYCLFTIGNGDFTPQGDLWQVLSGVVGLTGMLTVTLAVTYILQVISAVANKRAFASQVMSIGKTAEDFVRKQWTGKSFGAIELQLNSLSGQLSVLNEQHLAFPILHYYHAARVEKSQDMAIAILDDALTIIELGVKEENQPAETILTSTRQSINSFLITLKSAFISAADNTPPTPDLSEISNSGVPTVQVHEFDERLKKAEDRRKLILGLINKGAWHWPS